MKNLTLKLSSSEKPMYLRIAAAIRSAIKDGLIEADERLPSTRTLAEQLHVHRHTVTAALDELVAEGWLIAREKSAFRVAALNLPPALKNSTKKKPFSIQLTPIRSTSSNLSDEMKVRFDFRSGLADLREFPIDEYQSHLRSSLKRMGGSLLGYADPKGHPRFLRQLAIYLRRARSITNREIIVTHGSQEAIFMVAQSFLAPGTNVAVEALGYPPAHEAFRLAGATLIPIPLDRNGLDCDYLERVLKHRKLSLIYVTPLHQYPTTVSLSAERRIQLYTLAKRYQIPILEDDYDHEFHYKCQPIPPLASDDPEGLVLYVSSFSKVLLPSLRLGFLAVPPHLAPHFIQLRKVITRQNDGLVQETVARWMEEGGFERHLRRMCRLYEHRRDFYADEITSLRDQKLSWDFKLPDGGMVIWLDTGIDSEKLSQTAQDQGIALDPEQHFCILKNKGRHLRLGFTKHNAQEARRGLQQLAALITKLKK